MTTMFYKVYYNMIICLAIKAGGGDELQILGHIVVCMGVHSLEDKILKVRYVIFLMLPSEYIFNS